MITCKELILKEGDGERRTFYDLQVTGWVFLFFFAFLGCSLSCLNIFTFCHFPSDMRLSSKGLHQGAGGGGFGPPDSCRQALDRQTDLRVHRLLHSASWPARALEARVMRRADKQVGWGPDGWKAAALAAFIVPGASAAWSWAAPIGLELSRRSAFQGRSEH